MRLAISNIAWAKEHDDHMYAFLKEHQIDALEIAPTRLFDVQPYEDLFKASKYAQYLKDAYDLSIVSLQSIWYGKDENLFHSQQDRDALTEYTYKVIDFAHAIQCPNIVFGNPKQRDGFKSDYEKLIEAFFIAIADYAKEKDIVIALEPNSTIYGTNFLNTTLETIEFLQKVNHSNLKLNLDLGTMIENNETIASLQSNVHHIHHIHLSEPYLKPLQKRALHQHLKELQYYGVVSIEMGKIESVETLKSIILYVKDVLA